jgi:WD40 repeat protein
MLTAGADKKAWVWNASNGEPKLTLAGHAYAILAAGYSPDGKRIVTGSQDHSAKVWDAATGQELLTLTGHTGPGFLGRFFARWPAHRDRERRRHRAGLDSCPA